MYLVNLAWNIEYLEIWQEEQQTADFEIKPQNKEPTIDSSQWPLLLKVRLVKDPIVYYILIMIDFAELRETQCPLLQVHAHELRLFSPQASYFGLCSKWSY